MKCLSKKISLTFILLLTSLLCGAQSIEQYDLPSPVADITPNTDSTYLGIVFGEYSKSGKLKNNTQCGIFNVKTHKLTYMSDIGDIGKNYFRFLKNGVLIITTKEKKVVTIKYVDAEQKCVTWGIHNILSAYHISKPFSMIFAKHQDSLDKDFYLQLRKVNNGEMLWREKSLFSKIFTKDYIIDTEESNDSSEIFILSHKLFKFNIHEGVKKEYKYKKTLVNNIYNSDNKIYLTENEQPTYLDMNLNTSDINLYRSGDKLYLTENKQLTCLDMNLDTLWTKAVAPLSYHNFIEKGDTLYLINMGYINQPALFHEFSGKYVPQYKKSPYILSFNKQTGEQIDFIELDRKKYPDDIHYIYVDSHFYYLDTDSQSFRKVSTGKDQIMIALHNGDICITDKKQETIDKYEDKRCYNEMFKIDDTMCIGRICDYDDMDFFLINGKGDVTHHFPKGTKNVCHIGKEIFYCIESKLYGMKL